MFESVNTLERVCAQAFNQRRKTIRNSLKDSLGEEEIRELGIDPTSRAEVLSLNDFATIANAVSAKEHQQEQMPELCYFLWSLSPYKQLGLKIYLLS